MMTQAMMTMDQPAWQHVVPDPGMRHCGRAREHRDGQGKGRDAGPQAGHGWQCHGGNVIAAVSWQRCGGLHSAAIGGVSISMPAASIICSSRS